MPPHEQSDRMNYAGGFYTEIDGAGDYNNINYIHHTVTKFDTLPGLAIKYGVEVGDIKKMNGLVTDLQMFALPSLRIPLPGFHSPSCSSTCNNATSPSNINLLSPPRLRDSQKKVSSNMINLQQLYELNSPTSKSFSTGKEVGGSKTRKLNEKSRTAGNDSCTENNSSYLLLMESLAAKVSVDSSRHHWLRPELDFGTEMTENVSRKENEVSSLSIFSSRTIKGLALRSRSASRGSQASHDSEWSSSSSCYGDASTADSPGSLNQSCNYYNQEENSFTSFWSNTKRMIKIDLLNLSHSTLTKPLLEGSQTCKLKAALD